MRTAAAAISPPALLGPQKSLPFFFFGLTEELRFPHARADKDDLTGAVRFNKQQLGGDSALQLPVSVIRDLALRLSAPRRGVAS